MKKIALKALLFLLVLTFITALFASCAGSGGTVTLGKGSVDFDEVYKSSPAFSDSAGYNTYTDLSDVIPANATDVQSGTGNTIQYFDPNKQAYCFYNVEKDAIALEIDASSIAKATDLTISGNLIKVIKTEGDTQTTEVYSTTKGLLVQVPDAKDVRFFDDGFLLAGTLYHVEDGTVKKQYTLPPFLSVDDSFTFTDNYVVQTSGNSVLYYDESFALVGAYEVPGHASRQMKKILPSGVLFVEYYVPCDPAAEDFDLLSDGKKYTLHHELYDPDKDKVTSLSLGIAVYAIYNEDRSPFKNADFYDVFTDKVENVLSYYAIVDGVADQTTYRFVLLSDDGEIGAPIDEFVEGQRGLVSPLTQDSYYVDTLRGYAILDAQGSLVREVPAIGTARAYGYLYAKQIYDADMKLVTSFDVSRASHYRYELYERKGTDGTHYYRYDTSGETEILPPEGYSFNNNYSLSVIENESGYYKVAFYKTDTSSFDTGICYYYGASGEHLFTAVAPSSYRDTCTELASGDGAILIRYTDAQSNQTVYARLSK